MARLGGDEFAILVEDSTGTEQLADLARSVLAALQQPFDLAGQRLSVSASIGVVERAAAGHHGDRSDAGRRHHAVLGEGGRQGPLDPLRPRAQRAPDDPAGALLHAAAGRGARRVHAGVPAAGGHGGRGARGAWRRWCAGTTRSSARSRRIGSSRIAEEDGSIVQLGRWVLRTACRQARQWQQDHPDAPPLFVSVNVAVRQVWDSDLVADVAEILAETGLAPHLLQLELTESAVMGSAGRPLQALQALSDMGVRIAIDDFGTGYSNLAYLSRLPVSVLKLDGSFVRGFRTDEAHPEPGRRDDRRGDGAAGAPAGPDGHRGVRGDGGPGGAAAADRLRHGPGLAVLTGGGAGADRGADRRRRAVGLTAGRGRTGSRRGRNTEPPPAGREFRPGAVACGG